ncbi:MAG: hypothetical protein F6J94_11960 [Moorea sp. SIO1F2]|uniref:hypothetical protein n=1 Tax=unclassified Moorena TaxID=2683338 RepID=UPI0013BE8962|nr:MULTISPECIES: hypothetical protein [unclassified Moorena]NEP27999.1 hypothetical protein [Moorena sp. SIO3I6]NET82618.1 hypothetical protein [Moorena sp. SIO1F2]
MGETPKTALHRYSLLPTPFAINNNKKNSVKFWLTPSLDRILLCTQKRVHNRSTQ